MKLRALSLLPAALVYGGLLGGALIFACLQSLGFSPWTDDALFPTFGAYQNVFATDGFWRSAALTFSYAFVATLFGVIFAIPLALILRRARPFRGALLALSSLPLVVPYAVGIALAILMLGNGGMISRLAFQLGLIDDPAAFPQILNTHWGIGIIAVYFWKQLPFITLSITAALSQIGDDEEDAARLLGASPFQVFRHITLPMASPAILSASLICFAFNLGAFEAPFILGGGYPDTLPVIAYRLFIDSNYRNQAEAMAVLMVLVALSALVIGAYLILYRQYETRTGRR